MAITIQNAAADTSSINNEMLFVVYEATKANDPVTYVDYAYTCDVYVNSVMVARLISRPDPTYKMGIFDVSKALQGYASYGLDASAATVDYTVKLAYRLKFGEQYGGVLYTNLTVDSTDRECYETYKPRPFTNTAVLSNGLASNMPSIVNWHKSQAYQLIPFFSNVSGISNLVQTVKDINNNTTATNTTNNSGFVAKKIRQVNIGSAAVTYGSSDEYSLITGAGVNLRVNHLCDGKFTPYTLVWLNPFGAYESQSFGFVSKKTIELTRKDFEQQNYRINVSGVVSYDSNNVLYGGKKGFSTVVKKRISLTSHLLSDAEYVWLADLFISPDVYIYDTSLSKFIPVTITKNNYDYNTYLNSRLTVLQFDVEFTDMYNSQFL